jgi:acetylornithine deacetylase
MRRDAVELLERLVAIDSTNPTLVSGAAGEGQIAGMVAGWLERAGLAVEMLETEPGRPSVIARAAGRHDGRMLLLNAHMDTVGGENMDAPFEPRIDGERMYGRGAYDMKAGLVAIMLTAAEWARSGAAGELVVAAVADEEAFSIGSQAVAERVAADGAVVAEPTGLDLCIAHKGFAWGVLETAGIAAHGSRPDLGVDAIAAMGPALARLGERAAALQRGPGDPLLGPPSLHASIIEGGREMSTYPERCLVRVERRMLPGERVEDVERELHELAGGAAEARVTFSREPLQTPPEAAIVEAVRRAERARGREPALAGAPFWTDAALFAAAGTPTVVYGPGGEGAHAAVEWVDLRQLDACLEVLIDVARDFCAA